jgi:gamma-glutamyltranspeptidase/glutathione hydrolase
MRRVGGQSMEDSMVAYDRSVGARPTLMGTRHMVAAGHYLAAQAGFEVLEGGGNAVDAGVAACITLAVVQSEYVSVGGVAPMMIYEAAAGEVITIDGLGVWPKAATLERFLNDFGGKIPVGLPRTIVPAAPDAWLTALGQFGTMQFGDVAAAAIRFARDGFPMYPLMAELIAQNADRYRQWPSNAAIYLPDGRPPEIGRIFVQTDLGRTLQYMADEERAAAGAGRARGLAAARDAFYRGDIGKMIADYHHQNGGFLTVEDLASFRVRCEPPVKIRFNDKDVYACGPWCQGPALLQALKILEGIDLVALGHNTLDYIHVLIEAMKLAFADREAYYGDPRFVEVPIAQLLSDDYAARRRAMIDPDRAHPGMPAPGLERPQARRPEPVEAAIANVPPLDTSYACAVDRRGNAFSATPSDTSFYSPVIPGLGLCVSPRGYQSWAVRGHPAAIRPGSRPRLTPNPAMVVVPGDFVMPFGSPGGDVQCQAMLQALLNFSVWGMDPQIAVDQPRCATFSFPGSFEPHAYHADLVNLERSVPEEISNGLARRGHRVEWWPVRHWRAGGTCMIAYDLKAGVMQGGADPRRPAYVCGW